MFQRTLFWVGPRRSDLDHVEHLFSGAIVIMGQEESSTNFICRSFEHYANKRVNHNDGQNFPAIDTFFCDQIINIIKNYQSPKFMAYGRVPRGLTQELKSYFIGQNHSLILSMLEDKMRMRSLLSKYINVLPFTINFFHEITLASLKDMFPNNDQFILQEAIGSSGGNGTHILSEHSENIVLKKIKSKDLIVSPYFKKSISVNQHLVVFQDNSLIFPPSIQIIQPHLEKLIFFGSDYSSAKLLKSQIRNKIYESTKKIAEILQQCNYRGVAGIDYLIDENENLMFIEINSRFQASSFLLNRELISTYNITLQELHLKAFKIKSPETEFIINMETSFINVISSDKKTSKVKNGIRNNLNLETNDFDLNNEKIDQTYEVINSANDIEIEAGGTGYSCIFKFPIMGKTIEGHFRLQPNLLRLSNCFENRQNNITLSPISKAKFELLTLGVQLSSDAINYMNKSIELKMRYAIGYAIDIKITDKVYVNAPVKSRFSNLSPYILDHNNKEGFTIWKDNSKIFSVDVSLTHPLAMRKTNNGVPYNHMGQMINDRLRISPFPTCKYNKKNKLACKFCDIGYADIESKYRLEDICEMIDTYLSEDVQLRHFLIGGGTAGKAGWKLILKIAKHIRLRCNLDIYLMVTPPEDLSLLYELKEAGITQVGFNLEFFDRKLAAQIMPGKGMIPFEQYEQAFKYATSIWGNKGAVRSILIAGIEPYKNTLNGIQYLAKLGVMPILSSFRSTPNTEMEFFYSPSPDEITWLWKKGQEITEKYNLILGPECIYCQNNTISLPGSF